MRIRKFSLSILLILFVSTLAFSEEDNGSDGFTGLGFDFEMEKKEAMKKIKSDGGEIIENTVDSKEIRIVVVEGAFVELPFSTNGAGPKTRLEFYDDKLMSSSLIFEPEDQLSREELEGHLAEFLLELYGEPENIEEMLQFTTWTWRRPNVNVILSMNSESGVMEVQHMYEPINQARKYEEFEEIRKGKPSDPAKEMFLEGSYSRPTQYK